jgi:hypothetical protein
MYRPRWIDALEARLRAILARGHAEDDLDAELAHHLARQTEENMKRGMSEEEAGRRARMSLGLEQTKEATREGRPLRALETFAQDVRFACGSSDAGPASPPSPSSPWPSASASMPPSSPS